jgi:hypothetical protein
MKLGLSAAAGIGPRVVPREDRVKRDYRFLDGCFRSLRFRICFRLGVLQQLNSFLDFSFHSGLLLQAISWCSLPQLRREPTKGLYDHPALEAREFDYSVEVDSSRFLLLGFNLRRGRWDFENDS